MKIIIILNAVVYNRGSEALIRGFTAACKQEIDDCEICLVSSEKNFETDFRLTTVDYYINRFTHKNKCSLGGGLNYISRKFNIYNATLGKFKYTKMINAAKQSDVIIVIGADNYDKSYNMFNKLREMNLVLKKYASKPMILYDCSLEDKHFSIDVIDDLCSFDYITVREQISYKNFKDKIKRDNIMYYPDPAFMMEAEKCDLPFRNKNSKYIGLNLSTLVANGKYGLEENSILNSYHELITHILTTMDRNIILIPHVMKNADLAILKKLFSSYINDSRVELIDNENYNAAQLKYIISKLEMFVGARTHATIAAYSSFVPTLVIGYSVKSKGIATDLFGTDENYVLPVEKLRDSKALIDSFQYIYERRSEICDVLSNHIPPYQERAKQIVSLIKNYK